MDQCSRPRAETRDRVEDRYTVEGLIRSADLDGGSDPFLDCGGQPVGHAAHAEPKQAAHTLCLRDASATVAEDLRHFAAVALAKISGIRAQQRTIEAAEAP